MHYQHFTVIMQRLFQDNKIMKKTDLKMTAFFVILFIGIITGCSKVETTQPIRKDIVDVVFANGYLMMDEEYLVTANAEGYITQALVKEGDSVQENMPLFLLSNEVQSTQLANKQVNYLDAVNKANPNSPEVLQLKIQIEQAEAQLELDKKNYERHQTLIKINAVSQVELEKAKLQYENAESNITILEKSLMELQNTLSLNVQNTKSQLAIEQENNDNYFVSSSIQGQVLQVYKKQGELVRRGETIAKIGGGEILIKLYVAEEDINRVQVGQKTTISLNNIENQLFEAQVSKIYPAFDEQEQSYIIEAKFIQKPKKIFANTQLQVNILIDRKKKALLIPFNYLSMGDSVILESEKKVFVRTGINNGEWVEILEGLEESSILVLPKTNSK